jgi:hypothetical protein
MRTRLKYVTPALAACAAAVAIGAAPAAMAEPTPVQPAVVATASPAMAGDIVQARYGGGFHGGGGGWHGNRGWGGGWHGDRGWGGWPGYRPWGWFR